MARPRDIPGLDCEGTFAEAAAGVVEVRAGEVFEHADGVLDVADVEPLHDMRVATRRLRAALEMFRPCFPREPFRAARKLLEELARTLGERRDRDVSISILDGFLAQAPAADRGRVETVLERLRQEQEEANRRLAPLVAEEGLDGLRNALSALVEAAGR